MSTLKRAVTAPIVPDAPEPSHPGLPLPPMPLPPSVARHPLLSAVVVVVLGAVSTIGGVYAVQPKSDAVEIRAMGGKLDMAIERLGAVEQKLQRNEDRLGSRIDTLEAQQQRTESYHDARARTDSDWSRWQDRTDRRLDALEKRR